MARFKETEKGQGLFLTVNLEGQIQQGTFEWTARYITDRTGMSLYEKKYNNDEMGARACPPGILLKAVLFSYPRGIPSSRKIETACKENTITKAPAENCGPDRAAIAEFMSGNSGAAIDLFAQALFKCSELKLITGGMSANGGRKLPGNMKMTTGKEEPLKQAPAEAGTGFFSEGDLREAKKRGIEALIPGPAVQAEGPSF